MEHAPGGVVEQGIAVPLMGEPEFGLRFFVELLSHRSSL